MPRADEYPLVSWDSPTDPANPVNFSTRYRWTLILLASSITFMTSISSSMLAPAVPAILAEYDSTNSTLGSFLITVYLLGLGVGPLFWGPLSEIYGRLPVQHVGDVGFLAFTILCAESKSLAMLAIARLLQGTLASVPMVNGGALIADMVKQEERGLALSIYTMGILIAPSVGPVAGGFLATAKGWRWVFWLISIILGALSVMAAFTWRETYAPVILRHKAKKLRKISGIRFRGEHDVSLTSTARFKQGIGRVFQMLALSPIILMLSIYMGLIYSYFYLLLTTLAPVYEALYGWKPNMTGLAFLGMGVGFGICQLIYAGISDRILKSMAQKSGEMKPEYRLLPTIAGGLLVPVALFWYGWAAQARIHWIVPIIGTSLLAFGHNLIFMGIQSYIVDAFTLHAASGLSANAVTRSVMASVLPLAAPKMYDTLGLGWGNSLLGFLALAMVPVPWLFVIHGERLRTWNSGRFM
ncbi:MFS general substrate transporter [Periconia macrospinosa]|uniref:MFS general substrate transporter n=1 Tax=Periconia macrospinosa TaxID=97972 RepID=A0A2V1DD52_9PLEO|nr:MFS general substrate transporter [Periconia macrospinosa]